MSFSTLNPSESLRAGISHFVSLKEEDWALLSSHLTIKSLKKGQYFATEGKKAKEIGFVIDGMFRQFYTKDGEEKTTYFFFEDSFISAYISCITNSPSLITIEALSDSTIISFQYEIIHQLFDKSMVWQKFGRLIAEYLTIGLEERMVSLLLQNPEERYRELLLGNKKKILERVPHHYVANYLGITPVSLSRIRKRLASQKKK